MSLSVLAGHFVLLDYTHRLVIGSPSSVHVQHTEFDVVAQSLAGSSAKLLCALQPEVAGKPIYICGHSLGGEHQCCCSHDTLCWQCLRTGAYACYCRARVDRRMLP